jgi:hypothetical protein
MYRLSEILIAVPVFLYILTLVKGVELLYSVVSKCLYRNNKVDIVGLALPIYIIFGFLSHQFNLLSVFTSIVLGAGIFWYLKSLKQFIQFRSKLVIGQKIIFSLCMVTVIIYAQSFDALTHFSQNHPDSLSSLEWAMDSSKFLSPGYPAGLFILSSGLLPILDWKEYINILGLGISLAINFEVYRILKDILSTKLIYLFFTISLIPVFSAIIFTRTGFNAGILTFLILVNLIKYLYNLNDIHFGSYRIVIVCISSLFIQPQITLSWLVPLLITFIYSKNIRNIRQLLSPFLLLSIYCTFLIFFYLLWSWNSFETFGLQNIPAESDLMNQIIIVVQNVFSVIKLDSGIRPFNESLLSQGSYIFLVLMILVFFTIKDKKMKAVILFTWLLGLITTIGILEIDYFKGRTGFYFFYAALLTILLALERFRFKTKIISVILMLSATILLIRPPISYRIYDESLFFKLKELQSMQDNVSVYSQFDSTAAVDKNLKVTRMQSNLTDEILKIILNNIKMNKPDIVVLNTSLKLPDVKLSGQFSFSETNINNLYEEKQNQNQTNYANNQKLKILLLDLKYKIVVQEEDYLIMLNSASSPY